ncbi:MAG: cyclopropane-fatty-acyl-phospholipid synthase family protein [Burkholderiales bacterium]|nr:cyclopropane-fatty-acyl-phospholipid synthase family protein [Burkholderiales bacterium]
MSDGLQRTLPSSAGGTSAAERWLLRAVMGALPGAGFEAVLWDGTRAGEPGGLRVHVRDRAALWRLARNPELHFGDLYSEGRIEVEGDLVAFLERAYRALEAGRRARGSPLLRFWRDVAPRARSIEAARENIHQHYDLGNDFYALWLDRDAMQYTCAYFPEPGMTLEQAQRAKMHHVCRKLRLQPGQQVFEAGCGWGGFALFMAREYGVRVRAWNISHEQVKYATERARALGLADRVEYVEDDYRNIRGACDAFVSVGMLEHVGPENYPALGAVIDRTLAPNGFGLIHSIGRNRPGLMNAWIERRIFPGAQPPALSQMMAIFEPYDFSVLDVENLRLHYAETLRHWRARFQAAADEVRASRGEAFVRAWDLYLAGSIAAFTTGSLQLFQVVFARGENNDLPASRRHLYD